MMTAYLSFLCFCFSRIRAIFGHLGSSCFTDFDLQIELRLYSEFCYNQIWFQPVSDEFWRTSVGSLHTILLLKQWFSDTQQ